MDSPARPPQPAKMASSTGGTEGSSPASSPASAASLAAMAAPKFGTLVPNRVFVGGISANTSEAELAHVFSAYGNVKATKIIADRGGVSKGYGFVTFETEEEAKRLQQEPESIVLRERKLNIAPAIKKQPFNRSFDGGTGSPPAAPTSAYYYTNGLGIPYQNGMTFYNAGAPVPGAAIAPPADPAAMYQAGIFGPQATAGHQSFTPMMYPMPAPSLYMPQQYQYSQIPYEPYFSGTAAAGAPYIYASNGPQAQTGGNGSVSGNSVTTSGATTSGSTSGPPSMGHSPSQFQTHFYGPTNPHHHPASMTTNTHHGPPHPPMEPIYYSYPPPPPHAQPPHHGPLALASEQLVLYTTEIIGQPQGNDSQEESRSSNHAEQLQSSNPTTSDSGGGGGGPGGGSSSIQSTAQSTDTSNLPPHKYPPAVNLGNRYPNYQSVPQPPNASPAQQVASDGVADESASNGAPPVHHYRIYSTPVYMPSQVPQYSPAVPSPGASLLPTPPSQPYDKFRSDYASAKPAGAGLVGSSPYAKGAPLIHQSPSYVKPYVSAGLQQPSAPHGVPGQHKYQAGRVPQQPQQQYSKTRGAAGHHHHQQSQQQQQQQQPAFYFSPKACQYAPAGVRHGQPFVYRGPQLSPYALPHVGSPHKAYMGPGGEHPGSGRRGAEHSEGHSARQQAARQKSAIVNSYRGSNLTMSAKSGPAGGQERTASPGNSNSSNSSRGSVQAPETGAASTENSASVIATATAVTTSPPASATTASSTSSSNSSSNNNNSSSSGPAANVTETANATAKSPGAGPASPSSPYTPTTPHPRPTVSTSPNPNQVPLYGPSGGSGQQQQQQQQQRYNNSSSSTGPGLSQQRNSGGRYQSSSAASRGGKSANVLRQPSGNGSGGGKYKVNGIVQPSKLEEATNLGGAGDAPPIGSRLSITPPSTPQQQSSSSQGEQAQQQQPPQQQQIGEACHQMQALSL